jgi:hypothetical protein
MQESDSAAVGGDTETLPLALVDATQVCQKSEIVMKAPEQKGAHRYFVRVTDSNNSVGHANMPFWVE